MFQFVIGSIFGFFLGFIIFVATILTNTKFDAAIATNVIIALATVAATTIHFSSIKQQRKDRLWDINKTVLLDLSHTLSKVIKASEYYLQKEYASQHIDDNPPESDAPSKTVFKDFEEKQEYALNVYKALMSKDLIHALQEAKRINENIDDAVNNYGIDHIQAYEESISTNKKLQEELDFFVSKISGVGNI